jgi:hypothetical protein
VWRLVAACVSLLIGLGGPGAWACARAVPTADHAESAGTSRGRTPGVTDAG